MSNIICLLGKNILVLQESSFCKQKSLPPRTYLCKRRKTLCPTRYHSYFMNYVIHSWDTERVIVLISSPYNGGHRLHLLSEGFRQLLKGEFHNFLPLLLSSQQFSVLWSMCTIPHPCISLIFLIKPLKMILT